MLTYPLQAHRAPSLYEQLYQYIKADILTHRLQPEEKLPSKRRLAEHLQISVITVENAYAQLAAEGYITPIEKRGYFVNRVARQSPAADPVHPAPAHKETAPPPATGEGFPFALWSKWMRSVISEQGEGLLAPLEFNGAYALRKAISDYLYAFRGIRVSEEQIIIGAGTEYLYTLLVQLLGRNKIYAFETPGHSKIHKIYTANDVQCCPVPLDEKGLCAAALYQTPANVLHISPAHHYPTGTVMPVTRRQELLDWAAQGERYILEDDYDSEFRFVGKPIPTMFGMDHSGRVIYLNTFSKTLAPSIRISYMVLPPALMERYKTKLQFYACTVPSLEQYTLAAFIRSGGFERHISRMKIRYRKKRDAVIHLLRQTLGPALKIHEKDAGLHFSVTVEKEEDMQKLFAFAKRYSVRITPLADFDLLPGRADARTAVVDYAGFPLGGEPKAPR